MFNFSSHLTEYCTRSKSAGLGDRECCFLRPEWLSRLFFLGVTSKIGELLKTDSCSVEKAWTNLIRKQRTK